MKQFNPTYLLVIAILCFTTHSKAQTTILPGKAATPELISPKNGDVLDNGCQNRKNGILHAFEWSEVPGARRYHLYVKHPSALIPVIDASNINTTAFCQWKQGSYVAPGNDKGWTWKVRAMVEGVWTAWSMDRTFDIEPLDTDCRSSANTPAVNPIGKADSAPGELNLTGKWYCDDQGVYYLRQLGNQLWWYGQSADGGNAWTNIFHGTIEGRTITGNWADVPHGGAQGSGRMTLVINGPNSFRALSKSGGGFSGSSWRR